jgi:hypothetical protein
LSTPYQRHRNNHFLTLHNFFFYIHHEKTHHFIKGGVFFLEHFWFEKNGEKTFPRTPAVALTRSAEKHLRVEKKGIGKVSNISDASRVLL